MRRRVLRGPVPSGPVSGHRACAVRVVGTAPGCQSDEFRRRAGSHGGDGRRSALGGIAAPHPHRNRCRGDDMTATYTFDVFSSLDGYGAAGGDWSGYWGKQGPELLDHRLALYGPEQRMVFGARTYRVFAQMLAASSEGSDVRDPWVTRMRNLPATVVSTTLEGPLDWPNATVAKGDAVDVVARLKEESQVPLRSHGSLSMNRALMAAGLVDRVQVTLFPVITGRTGLDPVFEGAADFDWNWSRTGRWTVTSRSSSTGRPSTEGPPGPFAPRTQGRETRAEGPPASGGWWLAPGGWWRRLPGHRDGTRRDPRASGALRPGAPGTSRSAECAPDEGEDGVQGGEGLTGSAARQR
uniref:Putative dihydrofolate reductase n=1 Tax=Streptomyces ambofaciens (strain ATCC 23877 / 3486 / DSM 40053 / JCM 4204 / NBRC 12836 / NRRL B-2516) TaxID=278992 RepID=A3KIK1_STRA7|nr:putative dihydrofolate reductase [Streptomyces ambofaciens ATCC 23877]